MNTSRFFITVFSLVMSMVLTASITVKHESIDLKKQKITVFFAIKTGNYLYKDSLNVSVDSPEIVLSDWSSSREAVNHYDEVSKETKLVFDEDFYITFIVENSTDKAVDNAFLHVTYHYSQQSPQIELIPLSFSIANASSTLVQKTEEQTIIADTVKKKTQHEPAAKSSPKKSIMQVLWNYAKYVSTLIEQTKSTPIRILLVFLLGILLSLTPCIYPMIPITVGILQAQRSSSFIYNFFLAFCYTMGLATTFACFGLLASCSGPLYGKLLVHPLSVAFIVIILLYLAFSMFGLYELYIPRVFQSQHNIKTNGSLVSAFIFGAASGTIASPCVSPGLALLLSIVATLGNTLLGFLLLFSFGVGLSTPLLVIGTFSNSLTMFPKTGSWMLEIKKFFGFMLIGVCLYYLSNIVPLHILMFITSLIILVVGIYYVYSTQPMVRSMWKTINNIFGMLLIALSVVLLTQSFKMRYQEKYSNHASIWHTSYEHALHKARAENKKIFIDFWAQFCSICTAINKTLLVDQNVMQALNLVVPLSVDGTNEKAEPYNTLKNNYTIVGFPTFLLVDPVTNEVIKQWGSELYTMPAELFINELMSSI